MEDAGLPLVDALDSKRELDIDEAWLALRSHSVALMPAFKEAYTRFDHAKGRVALVFHATQFARVSPEAYELGVIALEDRSKIVRFRACGLLAYSLQYKSIAPLSKLLNDADAWVRDSANAALTAVRAQNHHLFVDRTGSGKSFWVVNPETDQPR